MNRTGLDHATDAVTVVTLLIGVAFAMAPARAGAVLGLAVDPATGRLIGGVDLALGAGLALGRPRWPWMAARAALNAALAGLYGRQSQAGGGRAAASGAVGMTVLTVVDGTLCRFLRARGA